ncbi:MAG: tetratricopeptide repeat protein [Cyanobacteria bacterium HKST-UBA02]|nr:tetratricopeptide repeat protein [Cyanobacteria bacterium HKST-UBA02]
MKPNRNRYLALLLSIATGLLVMPPAAMASSMLSRGMGYYNRGEYRRAKRCFEFYVKSNPGSWKAHYSLARAYVGLDDFAMAKQEFLRALRLNPDEATRSAINLSLSVLARKLRDQEQLAQKAETEKLASAAPAGQQQDGEQTPGEGEKSEKGEKNKEEKKEPEKQLAFKDRLVIVEPVLDHPPVRQITISTVRNLMSSLPANIYTVLSQGGATVNLAPNITDRWPEMLDTQMSAQSAHLADAAARTYDHDIYIYERPIVPGSKRLSDEPFTMEGVTNVFYHELGHALDDCSGLYSGTDEVLRIHRSDVAKMTVDTRKALEYYTQDGAKGASEACAEVFAGLMGAQGKDTENVANNFPALRQWMARRWRLGRR